MNDSIHDELMALCGRWRARARRFMAEAEQARRGADMIRLTAMASTLDWAESDLSFHLDASRPAVPLLPAETREGQAPQK